MPRTTSLILFVMIGTLLLTLMTAGGALGKAAQVLTLLLFMAVFQTFWVVARGVRKFGERYFASSAIRPLLLAIWLMTPIALVGFTFVWLCPSRAVEIFFVTAAANLVVILVTAWRTSHCR